MAKEGRKLTSFYAAPVCSPSRSALMTGCYPKRVLPIPGVLFPASAVGLHPDEVTAADALKEAGYATACVGKWHLGDQAGFLPTNQGFDFYLGIPYSNDMGPASEGSKSNLGTKLPETRLANLAGDDELGLRGMSQPPLPLVENTKVIARVKQDGQQAIVETYTKAAVKFIKDNRAKPFFLYLPHSAVHFPLYPGKKWAGKSPNGHYSDWVEEMDWSVGQVLDTVRDLKLDSNTLVIFTSDNGGTTRALNTPLRGNKGSTWEGGIRVGTLAWWPGKIPAGTQSDAITGMFDVLPTLAGLAGAPLPANRKLDGMNIWPVLADDPGARGHDEFLYFHGLDLRAVRSGPWKLHLPGANKPAAKKGGKKQAAATGVQLYNLDSDIGEERNVAEQNPEIVQRLQVIAAAVEPDLGVKTIGPGSRPLGRVKNPQPFIHQDGTVRADAVGTAKSFP
jgi:arylsulfatase A